MKLLRCFQCQSFFPPAANACTHCGNTKKSNANTPYSIDRLIKKGVIWFTGSTLSVTLAACYGMPCASDSQSASCKANNFPCADLTQDKDGDGYCGEWDCNEEDKTIHYGANDPLGDKIDQDCNGVDGRSAPSNDLAP